MLVDDRPSHPVAEPALSHEDSGQLGPRPSFAEKLNRRIDSELRMLSKHNENVAASDRLAVSGSADRLMTPP